MPTTQQWNKSPFEKDFSDNGFQYNTKLVQFGIHLRVQTFVELVPHDLRKHVARQIVTRPTRLT